MQETNNITREVLEITEINLEGNIIPHNWYSAIKKPNGSPDINAIVLLAEIVYWYRGVPVKDEATGKFLGYRKKFKEEMLQKSYKSLEEQFGFSKKQIRTALIKLEEMGLIERVFKNIELENNAIVTNVMYIKIFPQRIAEITFGQTKKEETSSLKSKEVIPEKETPLSQKGNTSFPENTGLGNTSFPKSKEVVPKKETPSFPKGKHPLSQKGNTYTEITYTENTYTEIDNISANAKKDFAFADDHDIDNSKKNISTNSSSKHSKSSNELEQRKQQANEIYSEYASLNKESNTAQNKKRAITNITKLLLEFTPEELAAAARNYAEYRVKKQIHNLKYIKDPANFYGQRKDSRYFYDFLPGRYEKIEQMATEAEAEDEFERIKENLKDIYGEEE